MLYCADDAVSVCCTVLMTMCVCVLYCADDDVCVCDVLC